MLTIGDARVLRPAHDRIEEQRRAPSTLRRVSKLSLNGPKCVPQSRLIRERTKHVDADVRDPVPISPMERARRQLIVSERQEPMRAHCRIRMTARGIDGRDLLKSSAPLAPAGIVRPRQVGDRDDAQITQAITGWVRRRDQAKQWVLLAAEERTSGLVDVVIVDRCDTNKREHGLDGPSLERDFLIRVTKLGPARATRIVREVDEDAERLEARNGAPQIPDETLSGVDRRCARVVIRFDHHGHPLASLEPEDAQPRNRAPVIRKQIAEQEIGRHRWDIVPQPADGKARSWTIDCSPAPQLARVLWRCRSFGHGPMCAAARHRINPGATARPSRQDRADAFRTRRPAMRPLPCP